MKICFIVPRMVNYIYMYSVNKELLEPPSVISAMAK